MALAAAMATAHPDLSVTLETYAARIRENPGDFQSRAERTWLLLERENPGGTVREDIDSLLSRPEWRAQGLRLRAYHLFLTSRLDEAKALILENMRNEKSDGPEQPRLLARIGLAKGDTGAAIQAYAQAWEKRREEADFLDMLGLYRARPAPEDVLKRGLARHPQSPGVFGAVFDAYMAMGDKVGTKKALEVSHKAVGLWPRGVDWKIKHAGALLGNGRGKKAEETLLAALVILDESSRLDPNAATTKAMRKEIFDLLEAVRDAAETRSE